MGIIQDELHKLGITYQDFSILQDKDGVIVARVVSGKSSYVVKCFQNNEYKREMEMGKIFLYRDSSKIRD